MLAAFKSNHRTYSFHIVIRLFIYFVVVRYFAKKKRNTKLLLKKLFFFLWIIKPYHNLHKTHIGSNQDEYNKYYCMVNVTHQEIVTDIQFDSIINNNWLRRTENWWSAKRTLCLCSSLSRKSLIGYRWPSVSIKPLSSSKNRRLKRIRSFCWLHASSNWRNGGVLTKDH